MGLDLPYAIGTAHGSGTSTGAETASPRCLDSEHVAGAHLDRMGRAKALDAAIGPLHPVRPSAPSAPPSRPNGAMRRCPAGCLPLCRAESGPITRLAGRLNVLGHRVDEADAITTKVLGDLASMSKATQDRGAVRDILGGQLIRELLFK